MLRGGRRVKVLQGIGIAVLGLFALNNLSRGGVHVFAPDGGAASMAGLDLTSGGAVIVSLLGAIGVMQMIVGAFELFVLTRRRDLMVVALGLQAALSVGGVLVLQMWKPLPMPETVAMVNLGLAGLASAGWLSGLLSRRSADPGVPA